MMRAIFILLCLFSSFVHAGEDTCQQRHCLAVVDAGSTGSRLHVYAYDLDDHNRPIQIEQVGLKRMSPGLANIELKNLDTYLTHLFSQAPEETIPVYVYATAGMRLVSHTKQQQYYQSIQQWFNHHPQWRLQDAKTISGKQEGIFGWLAVNYQLGVLQSDDKPLVSMMDMGGASIQIATPAEHLEAIDEQDLVQLNIYGRHVDLFVHSFLGLGQTEVSHHYLNAAHCFPYDYPLPNESKGQGDAEFCQQDISTLINSVHKVDRLVKPVLAANATASWYVVSGLGSLARNNSFDFGNNQFTSQSLLKQADKAFCQQSWHALSHQSDSNEYSLINCLSASYYYGLLVNGYGLSPNQLIHFMSDEEEPDWTLGVVLQLFN